MKKLPTTNYQRNINAFTLVELAIVLVIVGLLFGGVLAGRELIKAAERNKIVQDIQKYSTAFNTYKLKYNALPGDHRNAATFFTTANCSISVTNGNGDKSYAPWYFESAYYFHHMFCAKMLVTESFDNTAYSMYRNPEVNTGSFYKPIYWIYTGDLYGSSYAPSRSVLNISGIIPGSAINAAALSAEWAEGIDAKLDDGLPLKGNLIGIQGSDVGSGCTTGSGITSAYDITSSNVGCRMFYALE